MNNGKSVIFKIFLSAMVLVMLYTSINITTASAVSAATSLNPTLENGKLANETEGNDDKIETTAFGYWNWVRGVLLVFVGVAVANAFITNAVNNGIDAACDKWDDNWGVRQACKVFG